MTLLSAFPLFVAQTVVAQAAQGAPDVARQLLHPWFVIAIVAILAGTLWGIVDLLIRHRERMAMIRAGMHPDLPPTQPTTSPAVETKPVADLEESGWQTWK